jgi:hypothetical protein
MGLSLDWSREIATCDASYYRHQQAMFLEFWKAGLVERKSAKVNWDPVDMTVLANEQVIDGKGWRSGAEVEQRDLTQWFFKITRFSQELLDGLDRLLNEIAAAQAELDRLDPHPGEEVALDARRRLMQAAERMRADVARASAALGFEGAEGAMSDARRWLDGVAARAEGGARVLRGGGWGDGVPRCRRRAGGCRWDHDR